jgi:hypothetical protein
MKASQQLHIDWVLSLNRRAVVPNELRQSLVGFCWLVTHLDIAPGDASDTFNVPPTLLKVPEQTVRE